MNRLELAAKNSELTEAVKPLVGEARATPVACTPTTVALVVCCFNVGFIAGKAAFGHNEVFDHVPATTPRGLDTMSADEIVAAYLAA
ncbi:MAG TPA: hypothetical protein VJT49_19000 [Amycolatopsis sp.]|uniref:hypothetical protein n=1 Tax=Amycolatopsis sp. TaxID=37632 RepID=UPI002B45E497|nr:hypothetical protein [Amycolatopsis sp.]HKS47155.1 hypothetical protein [Amycolatopsis sp.]